MQVGPDRLALPRIEGAGLVNLALHGVRWHEVATAVAGHLQTDSPSPHKRRLAPCDTNPVNHVLREWTSTDFTEMRVVDELTIR
ncbi:MAG: hypothetical protein ACYTG5_16065 [Planctomycetota bacterium]